MRTDRRTDVTKLIFAFRNFADAPKNGQQYYITLSYAYSTRHSRKVPAVILLQVVWHKYTLTGGGQLRNSYLEQLYT